MKPRTRGSRAGRRRGKQNTLDRQTRASVAQTLEARREAWAGVGQDKRGRDEYLIAAQDGYQHDGNYLTMPVRGMAKAWVDIRESDA